MDLNMQPCQVLTFHSATGPAHVHGSAAHGTRFMLLIDVDLHMSYVSEPR